MSALSWIADDIRRNVALDRLAASAATIAVTPMALISFVGEDRQWFRSRVGIDLTKTPLSTSFCTHAIRSADPLFEVTDARADERFKNYALVTGRPNIRFYAGAPVRKDGVRIGTICVLDDRPRLLLSEDQRKQRIDIASRITRLIAR